MRREHREHENCSDNASGLAFGLRSDGMRRGVMAICCGFPSPQELRMRRYGQQALPLQSTAGNPRRRCRITSLEYEILDIYEVKAFSTLSPKKPNTRTGMYLISEVVIWLSLRVSASKPNLNPPANCEGSTCNQNIFDERAQQLDRVLIMVVTILMMTMTACLILLLASVQH